MAGKAAIALGVRNIFRIIFNEFTKLVMNKSEEINVVDLLQNVFVYAEARSTKLENKNKALKELDEIEAKVATILKSLRIVVDEHGELHVDLNGKIFKISSSDSQMENAKNEVMITEIFCIVNE